MIEPLTSQRNRDEIEKTTRYAAYPGQASSFVKNSIPSEFFGRVCKLRPSTSRKTVVKDILYPSKKSLSFKKSCQKLKRSCTMNWPMRVLNVVLLLTGNNLT